MIKNALLVTIAAFVLAGCFGAGSQEETWQVYLYPDKTNTKRTLILPTKFPTIEECRKSASLELDKRGLTSRGDYKCGLNCNYHEGMKVDICEAMKK